MLSVEEIVAEGIFVFLIIGKLPGSTGTESFASSLAVLRGRPRLLSDLGREISPGGWVKEELRFRYAFV